MIEHELTIATGMAETLSQIAKKERFYRYALKSQPENQELRVKAHLLRWGVISFADELIGMGEINLVRQTLMMVEK